MYHDNLSNKHKITAMLTSFLGVLVKILFTAGFLGFIIWLGRGFWDMLKGKGPGSLPWL